MSELSDIQILKLSKQRQKMIQEANQEPKNYVGKKPPFILRMDTELKKLNMMLMPITTQVPSNRETISNGIKKPQVPKLKPTISAKQPLIKKKETPTVINQVYNQLSTKDISLNGGVVSLIFMNEGILNFEFTFTESNEILARHGCHEHFRQP